MTDPKQLASDLRWHANYDREEQIKRLNLFLKYNPNKNINNFLWSGRSAEHVVDSHISLLGQAADAIEALTKEPQKKFWQIRKK